MKIKIIAMVAMERKQNIVAMATEQPNEPE
jgi:hypothetical protein